MTLFSLLLDPISFEQDMQMFNNNGNETFTFTASYSDNIAVKNGIQMGGIDGSNGIQWAIRIDTAVRMSLLEMGPSS